MRIYTRTGDHGTTGLIGGSRVSKACPRMRAIGDVDELNALLGVAAVTVSDPGVLQAIQSRLFDLGAVLAQPAGGEMPPATITDLEGQIDVMVDALPPLRNFILPGGSRAAATLHHARTVCRRAERSTVELAESEPVHASVLVFLNRLSDWLFVAARTANAHENVRDIDWTSHPV